jgi:adenosine deaminase
VLESFLADGVTYLELRTTPRATPHLSPEAYVRTILAAMADFNASQDRLRTRLILSVDRRHDLPTASGVVELAISLKDMGVVGVDLCGDPTAKPGGEVRLFTPVFEMARNAGLGITVHFAEAQASGSREELDVLLSWQPKRLGHVIWEDDEAKKVIAARGLCLELCLSCNVQAEMVSGGYKGHHFGYWRDIDGPRISLAVSNPVWR